MKGNIYKWPNSISICENELFCDFSFMGSTRIVEECKKCLHQSLCISLAEMLKKGKRIEVENLIDFNFKQKHLWEQAKKS